jgi:hypothetical protein
MVTATTPLLLKSLPQFRYRRLTATCQSGYGAVCKTVYPGSIPGVASTRRINGCKINGLSGSARRTGNSKRRTGWVGMLGEAEACRRRSGRVSAGPRNPDSPRKPDRMSSPDRPNFARAQRRPGFSVMAAFPALVTFQLRSAGSSAFSGSISFFL